MKIVIYAHYSLCDRIVEYAWPYLANLLDLGFKVIFVSNSAICFEDVERLRQTGAEIMIRDNIGLDFGMWKSALETVKLDEIDELLLTNSSIIGPFAPLASIFERAAHWPCDFWGITDNTEPAPHLQSYFIVLRKNVLESQAFINFWNSVLPYHSKEQLIRSYEIGLTVWLEENGFTWYPLIAQRNVRDTHDAERTCFRKVTDWLFRRQRSFENSALGYPELILKMGCPFLKKSLLVAGSHTTHPDKAAEILRVAQSKAKIGSSWPFEQSEI